MEYTLEVFKKDKRYKTGKRKIAVEEITRDSFEAAEAYGVATYGKKAIVNVYETYVTRINLMSGEEFTERYDTPICCSPSSETYWSM